MTLELAHVREDLQPLGAARQELSEQLQAIEADLVKAREDSQQAPEIKAEIETMHKEVKRGRYKFSHAHFYFCNCLNFFYKFIIFCSLFEHNCVDYGDSKG